MFGKHGKPFLSRPLMDLNYSVTYLPISNKKLRFSFFAFSFLCGDRTRKKLTNSPFKKIGIKNRLSKKKKTPKNTIMFKSKIFR
jgi:hypothetical protein